MSLQEIADGLEGVHIIHNRNEFIRYMTDNQLQHAIQIGKFEFKNNMSYEEIAEIITK